MAIVFWVFESLLRVLGGFNESFLGFWKGVLCHLAESNNFLESSSYLAEYSSHVAESSSHVAESSSHVADSSSHLVESSSYLAESSSHVVGSSSHVEECSSHFAQSSSQTPRYFKIENSHLKAKISDCTIDSLIYVNIHEF
jgi:hypothetical protein